MEQAGFRSEFSILHTNNATDDKKEINMPLYIAMIGYTKYLIQFLRIRCRIHENNKVLKKTKDSQV